MPGQLLDGFQEGPRGTAKDSDGKHDGRRNHRNGEPIYSARAEIMMFLGHLASLQA